MPANFAHDAKIDIGTRWTVEDPTNVCLDSHRCLVFEIMEGHADRGSDQLGGLECLSIMYATYDGETLEVTLMNMNNSEYETLQFNLRGGQQVILRQINDFVFKHGARCPFGWTDVLYLVTGAPHHSQVQEEQAA